jgi:DNA-binding LacI/PurR family transcriptional regulator
MAKPRKTPQVIRSTAEFAAHVGLSRSTVSRALNGHPGLKQKTIDRVKAALEATGFRPNAHAVNLRGRRAAMVGVCMEDFRNPTAVAKVSLLQQRLREQGLTTLIEVLAPGSSRQTLGHLLSLRVGAVVFIGHFEPSELAAQIDELTRHSTPHLVIDDPGPGGANSVSLDRVRAMERVIEHLVALGHRSFGLLGISGAFRTVTDRLTGVDRALRAAGLDPAVAAISLDPQHVRRDHFEYGSQLARSFLAQRRRPTAYLAVNDDTAVGALLEFQAAGLKVPDDLSLFGFNNQNLCLMTRPKLSSVDQNIEGTIDLSVKTLLAKMGSAVTRRFTTHRVEPYLVLRGTTGPAPAPAER